MSDTGTRPDEQNEESDSATVTENAPSGPGENQSQSDTPKSAVESAGEISDSTMSDPDESGNSAPKSVPQSSKRARTLRAARRPRVLLLVLVLALLVAATGYLGVRLHQESTAKTSRAEAVAAGEKYAVALTSYDFHDLKDNFSSVTRNSSPRFGQQYKQVSDSLTKLIQQYQATSKGTVVNRGVAEAGEQRAVLLLFVDQSVTNTNSPQPRVDHNRMRMTMVRSGDRWLVDDVQLV